MKSAGRNYYSESLTKDIALEIPFIIMAGKETQARDYKDIPDPRDTSVLSDRELVVLETVIMRLTEAEAMEYLKVRGHKMSLATWYSDIKKLNGKVDARAAAIARKGLLEQHIKRIDNLQAIEHQMWINYHQVDKPFQKILALEKIGSMQGYIAAAYDRTRVIIEKQAELKAKVIADQVAK